MSNKIYGKVVFKDGHTEDIIGYYANRPGTHVEVRTASKENYLPFSLAVPHSDKFYVACVGEGYSQSEYRLVDYIERFEILKEE